ncbi:MAG TPA: pilin [Candidatus Paceibacterota bacterium]|nr:pilin [Candidatus Paceibacterota bacterium]
MSHRLPFRIVATGAVLFALLSISAPHAYAACANTLIDDNGQPFCADSAPATSAATPSPTPGGSNLNANTTASPGSNLNSNTTNPASGGNTSGTLLVNPLKGITSLPDLLKAVLGAIMEIGTIVLILALVWVGFSFVRAQGNPEELKKARSALVWTIIGGAILLGAQALSDVIQSTVNNL